jgi:hypothetical protein
VEEGVSRLQRGGKEEPPGVDEGLALVGSQLVATGVDLEPGEVNVFKLTKCEVAIKRTRVPTIFCKPINIGL